MKSSHFQRSPIIKCHIAIFICMATKIIHIEVVSSLSTEAFLMTLKRLIARRGNVSVVHNDNASNFLGAKNQIVQVRDFFRNHTNCDAVEHYYKSSREKQYTRFAI